MLHTNSRLSKNNFDLLRFLLALTVCLSHASSLAGFPQINVFSSFFSSETAVKAFFVVSGFLIFMSYERSSSLIAYLRKRIRRIYPAYFTVVMLCALLLFAVSSTSVGEYFSGEWFKYVFANLTFLNPIQPELPGVFAKHLFTDVNGSLWTIKIEVMFYLSVPILVFLFRKFSPLPVMMLVYGLSISYTKILEVVAVRTNKDVYEELSRQLPGQLSYFMAGAFFYYFLPLFERYVQYFLAVAVAVLVINSSFPLFPLEPFALATVVMFLGLFVYLGNFGVYGDFSYGFYILHYPFIQIIIHFGWFKNSPWLFLAAVLGSTMVAAVAMWNLVEKRFLGRRSHAIPTTANSSTTNPANHLSQDNSLSASDHRSADIAKNPDELTESSYLEGFGRKSEK